MKKVCMPKLSITIAVFFSILLSACNGIQTGKDLTSKLADSKNFQAYMDLNTQLRNSVKSGRYNYAHVDQVYINTHDGKIDKNVPVQKLYDTYTKAGMTNAKEFVDDQLVIQAKLRKVLIEFPELEVMTGKERFQEMVNAGKLYYHKN